MILLEITAVRNQGADDLAGARHLMTVDVTIGGGGATNEFRMRAVRADGPERVAAVARQAEAGCKTNKTTPANIATPACVE